MNQITPGESSSGLPGISLKRRRGRPRKDRTLKPTETPHVPPGFEGAKEYFPQVSNAKDKTDPIVGQPVTGVVEGTFDAGYLLNVRIGDSNMNLRGVVFKPGHFVPVTADNDVAPHLQMIRRNDINTPAENQGWSRRQKLAIQTGGSVSAKRKYTTSPRTAPSVPPVGVRGTLVPVVLQPINFPNGSPSSNPGSSGSAHLMAFGDKDVHMVEPLSMLPPDRSIPAGQIFLNTQSHTGHQINQGSERNVNEPFNEGVGQGGRAKPVESTEVDNLGSSEVSDVQTDNSKEALKSPAEDSGIVSKQETGHASEPISSESFQTASVTKPLFSYGTGRMTELLQAVQENIKDNQVKIVEPTASTSNIEFHGARNEAGAP